MFYLFRVSTEARPHNLRGHLGPDQNEPIHIDYTRPGHIKSKVGSNGQPISCEANYFRLMKKPLWCIYQYRVDFKPDVEDIRHRRYLLHQLKFGGFLFDGTRMFIVAKISNADDVIEKCVKGRDNDTVYRIIFKFTSCISMLEAQSIQVMNLILRSAMKGLKLQQVGRNLFDPWAEVRIFNTDYMPFSE